ncbi:twin-arginine translocase subunit TatC [Corynebacterium breve]|uniref:Sec-independent protein translocase protein TatC n=1 Tax=Corynebacterium breve TaxID=3049799 RepID=A0ABY8VH43_9CORY|nr:twin-arginine translocase subunit TatC [Corynebacterium breve]WIM68834.1 twin-arginine translocase subunit TatC [Corynebacterium breve]
MAEKTARRKRKQKNPDGSMPLVEHLQELRRRVIYSLLAMIAGTIIGFAWYQNAPFGLLSLGELIRGPYCNLPEDLRMAVGPDGECRLLATGPFEMFMLRLKVGALAGLVISSPFWLYQIWSFITPGLHKNEKRYTLSFVSLAVILFVAGAVLAYFILDIGLEFLLSMGDEFQTAWLTGEQYYNFVLALIVIFGVSFEIPLIIVMLNLAGLLEYDQVKDKRRIIIVVVCIFAAFMTPGQDPFSMVVLAVAINLLVEMALQFCRWNDKRQSRERPEWMDLDDDASSSLSAAEKPSPVEAPSAVSAPAKKAAPKQDTSTQNYFDDVL